MANSPCEVTKHLHNMMNRPPWKESGGGETMDPYVSQEVADALAQGRPVVALESTIITHGLPRPRNLDVALAAEGVLRGQGVSRRPWACWMVG